MNEDWIVTSEGVRIRIDQIIAYYFEVRYNYTRVITAFQGTINVSESPEELDALIQTYSKTKGTKNG